MKSTLLKMAVVTGVLALSTSLVQAQQKMGDNLGNHIATKDLQLAGKQILNASGLAIGATTITNGSVALKIGGSDKAISISTVAANADIVTPENGMIVYNSTDNKFYLYQNGAWVTFALSLTAGTNGPETVSNANGYTLTQVGQEMVLRLAPADATNPGIVTTGAQTFGGAKTFNGSVDLATGATLTVLDGASTLGGALTVGSVATNAATTLNGNLDVTGKTVLNGNTGTALAPVNGLVISNAVAAANTDTENVLVVDATTGEVRKSTLVANALVKAKIPVPVFTLGNNESTKIVLTITGIAKNDGIIVNYDADDLAANPGLEYISIINATATATDTVSITIADFRQEDGVTPLTAATALLNGKNFTVTRYRQAP